MPDPVADYCGVCGEEECICDDEYEQAWADAHDGTEEET